MIISDSIQHSLNNHGVVILPPMDVFEAISIIKAAQININCTILDPWYNKGTGRKLPLQEYDSFIYKLLDDTAEITDLIYLWGFPEIVGLYARYEFKHFYMSAWITWYYKNCPSVIRGWRSSQNACLQFMKKGRKLYPEHFLTSEQREKLDSGKMRFIPGPPSVIEEPLIIGFVGKNERTGHPAQKPEAVFDKLLLMADKEGDIIFDPMAGSGTTAACAMKYGMKSIICDENDEYICMMEKRLNVKRLTLN